ncbi:MAG: tripartite tricarboxylate transporter TctB family protein [Planctomycetes bacterium]|nr:tripartite tricarboxylate transporter TctB family protein [Planctomycetota bacterium]
MKEKALGAMIPAGALLAGCYWLYTSVTVEKVYDAAGPGSGFFPAVVAGGLIVTATLLLLGGGDGYGLRLVHLLPVAGLLLVVVLGHLVGTLPALAVFLLLWLHRIARYGLRFSLAVTAVATALLWLVFDYLVAVNFQAGVLIRMLVT